MPIIHKENYFVKKKMAARLSSHQVHYSKSLLGIIFNGFCFINLIPHFFDYLMCPYYPAYTMGCYQIVIGGDNGG